jgi:transcriptional regulator with XRE-family HTH domain
MEEGQSMTTGELWEKLTSGRDYRKEIVSSMLKRGTAMQIQGMMKQREWTQAQLAEKSGLTQGVISRASNPAYGNLTFNTVIDIAAGFDVAFIGKFVPFSEFSRWVGHLRDEIAFDVPDFEAENSEEQEQADHSQASAEETRRLLSAAMPTGHPLMGMGMAASPLMAERERAATISTAPTALQLAVPRLNEASGDRPTQLISTPATGTGTTEISVRKRPTRSAKVFSPRTFRRHRLAMRGKRYARTA